jgi:hypothetical protein
MEYQNHLTATQTSSGLSRNVPAACGSLINLCVSNVTEFSEPEIVT